MRKVAFALWMLMFVCVVPSPVFALEVSTVQNAIEQSGAKWEAGVPDKDNPMRLGLRPSVIKSFGTFSAGNAPERCRFNSQPFRLEKLA